MLELYMHLFEARSVNFESRGSIHGFGRDEVLGAAVAATKRHPLGNRVILAEMGDAHSLSELDKWAATILPELSSTLVSVVMGRPLPGQLERFVYASPRYDRARREARVYHSKADHAAKKGDEEEVSRCKRLAKKLTDEARAHVIENIMTNGKCPKCRGTGVTPRKGEQCQTCFGRGGVIPDIKEIHRTHGVGVGNLFAHLVDTLNLDRTEWVSQFTWQLTKEKAEA